MACSGQPWLIREGNRGDQGDSDLERVQRYRRYLRLWRRMLPSAIRLRVGQSGLWQDWLSGFIGC